MYGYNSQYGNWDGGYDQVGYNSQYGNWDGGYDQVGYNSQYQSYPAPFASADPYASYAYQQPYGDYQQDYSGYSYQQQNLSAYAAPAPVPVSAPVDYSYGAYANQPVQLAPAVAEPVLAEPVQFVESVQPSNSKHSLAAPGNSVFVQEASKLQLSESIARLYKKNYVVSIQETDKIKKYFENKKDIDLEEFKNFSAELAPQVNVAQLAENYFNQIDLDNDGKLDFDDFLVAYAFVRHHKYGAGDYHNESNQLYNNNNNYNNYYTSQPVYAY